MRLASVNTPQLLLPAPSTPPAAEKAGPSGDVVLAYNPQDQMIMSAGTYTVTGLNSDFSTDRLQSKDKVKAEGDSYNVPNTDKRFPGINAFAAVDRTLKTFEAAYGEKINWAFEDKSAKLGVTGDAGKDLNAYYSRDDQGLMYGGIVNVLKEFGFIEGRPKKFPPLRAIGDRFWLTADDDGVFFPSITTGRDVRKGQVLGFVRDYFGNLIQTVKAPAASKVMNMNWGMPVKKGAFLLWLGTIEAAV